MMTEPDANQVDQNSIPEVLDANAVAAVFGISPRVAARWLAQGTLPSRKVGKRRFALRTELLQALKPERPGPRRDGRA